MVQPAPRDWRVKYDGPCFRCGVMLHKGDVAVWDRRNRAMHCVECPEAPAPVEPPPVDTGVAGGSARREYERRMLKREHAAREKWGDRVGGLVVRFGAPPQSTVAWARGAAGEELLAAAIGDIAGVRLLHDRRVPGTRGNIDHIVVASAGVFIVDAKRMKGRIHVRDVGGWFRRDYRLYVGRRDRSALVDGLDWQVEAVNRALVAAQIDPLPPVTPVLCFIEGDWPFIKPPDEYQGVRLESERSLRRRLLTISELDDATVDRIWRALAEALPAKIRGA